MTNHFRRRPAGAISAIVLGSAFLVAGTISVSAAQVSTTPAPTPTLSAQFAPSTITAGNVSRLTVTVDNSASTSAANALSFTATLSSGLTVAAQPAPSTTCTGSTVTAAPGSSSVSLSSGTVPASSSCAVSVSVAAPAAGSFVVQTSELRSTPSTPSTLPTPSTPSTPSNVTTPSSASATMATVSTGTSAGVSATLVVQAPIVAAQVQAPAAPTWTLIFDPAVAATGATSKLTVIITPSEATSGLQFTIADLKGLKVATTPDNTTIGCDVNGSPTWSPAADATTLTFSNGSTNETSPCVVAVNVTGPDGTYTVTTSELTFAAPPGSPVAAVSGTLTMGTSATTLPITTVPTIATVTPAQLANTGTSRATVLTAGGLTFLAIGVSLVIASRRRLAHS